MANKSLPSLVEGSFLEVGGMVDDLMNVGSWDEKVLN
jgi:hypothetical protein